MAEELTERARELASHPPFDRLPRTALEALVRRTEVRYVRRDSPVIDRGTPVQHLFWIRSGAVEVRSPDGTLELRLAEGEIFGYPSVDPGEPSPSAVIAFEDTLVHLLPAQDVQMAREAHPSFGRYFEDAPRERLKSARQALHSGGGGPTSLLTAALSDLITRSPVAGDAEMSVRSAAGRMTWEGVSCLPVLREGRLVGIVTDRDLRSRVLAVGLDPETSIDRIMSTDPVTLPLRSSAFEALLAMTRLGVHHLPLMDGDRLAGVVTATDLVRRERANPIYVVGDVRRAPTLDAVTRAARGRERVFRELVASGTPPEKVERVLTEILDAIVVRLIEIVAAESGPAPAEWSWLAFGSQARGESGIHSDQDHGILLESDGGDPWFSEVAEAVSQGLRRAGVPFCPGRAMATEARWRQDLGGWRARFSDWVRRPVPEALLEAGIFFDFRPVWSSFESEATAVLRREVLDSTRGNEIFAAHLASAALRRPPPLGIFRRLVLERDGSGAEVLDLKHRGVIPIVELVRTQALEAGVAAVGTRERIGALVESGGLSPDGGADLLEAFDFISSVRFRHQAEQLTRGGPADSLVPPGDLSPLERRYLRDAFQVVRTHRELLASRFPSGLLG